MTPLNLSQAILGYFVVYELSLVLRSCEGLACQAEQHFLDVLHEPQKQGIRCFEQ